MKANSNIILLFGIVLFFSFSTQLMAQPGFDEGDDVVDVPAAPIDNWVYPMLFLGILLVYIVFKNNKKINA